MNAKFKGILIAVLTLFATLSAQQFTTLEETLLYIQESFSTEVTFANLSGVFSAIVMIAMTFVTMKSKTTEQVIKFDTNQATEKTEKLANSVIALLDNQKKSDDSLQQLSDIIFEFANNTSIDTNAKKQITDTYAKIKNNATNLSDEGKKLIEGVISKTNDTIQEVEQTQQAIKTESTSILDKYRSELNKEEV